MESLSFLVRMNTRLPKLFGPLKHSPIMVSPGRQFNCWTAGITKKHRSTYEKTYPTVLVFGNGSTINIRYSEPRKIIKLPLDMRKLSAAERQAVLENRKPRNKVKIVEEVDVDFDENRYMNFGRR